MRLLFLRIKAAGGGSTTGASSYEIKQLEQQNSRLRETLVRMRDLSAHEKHEFQKLQKDMDQKKSEILELGRTKEKLSARVEEMEHQIADLQEQVRVSFGRLVTVDRSRILVHFMRFSSRSMRRWGPKKWSRCWAKRKWRWRRRWPSWKKLSRTWKPCRYRFRFQLENYTTR